MTIARAAWVVVSLSELAGVGRAASSMLGIGKGGLPSMSKSPPSMQEELSSTSWVLYAAGSYCHALGSPQFIDLPDGLSLEECQDAALADRNCGDLVQSNAPHGNQNNPPKCKCTVDDAPACSTALSSVGNNLYRRVAATPARMTATGGTLVLYAASKYCPEPIAGGVLTDLGTVSTVEDCLSAALAHSSCVDLIQTNAPQGRLAWGEQPSCKCTSTALCPLSGVASTSTFNNLYQYTVVTPSPTTQYFVLPEGDECASSGYSTVDTAAECQNDATPALGRNWDNSPPVHNLPGWAHGCIGTYNGNALWNAASGNTRLRICKLEATPAPTPATPSPTLPPTASPTPSPTPSPTVSPAPPPAGESAQAIGDPHLSNVLGQRFDLHQEGWHTLVRVPRGAERRAALLSVEAEARQMGVACADMYFQSVNVTGRWVGSRGRVFSAGRVAQKEPRRWLRYGKVELKVVQGHTKSGIIYLNFFVRHLKLAGYPVGGILGMDDHTAAAALSQKCRRRISLLAIDGPLLSPENASTAAADLE